MKALLVAAVAIVVWLLYKKGAFAQLMAGQVETTIVPAASSPANAGSGVAMVAGGSVPKRLAITPTAPTFAAGTHDVGGGRDPYSSTVTGASAPTDPAAAQDAAQRFAQAHQDRLDELDRQNGPIYYDDAPKSAAEAASRGIGWIDIVRDAAGKIIPGSLTVPQSSYPGNSFVGDY